jgi:transposase
MVDVALDQQLGTFLRLHEEAFHQLCGVPAEILYDRAKTVWLGTDERGEIRCTRCFWTLRTTGASRHGALGGRWT